jgi:outer membrane protein assembly factor BamB
MGKKFCNIVCLSFVFLITSQLVFPLEIPSAMVNERSELLDSPWPMECHDTRHTGLSPYNTSDTPSVVKWRLGTLGGGGVDGGIAIDNNGILYFGSNDFCTYAVDSNGILLWGYDGGSGGFETTPAIAVNGTIYIGSWDGKLYAFTPTGTLVWRHSCGGSITHASPVIAEDGTIFVGTAGVDGKSLVAIRPDGTEKWRYQTGGQIEVSPVITLNEDIIFGSDDTYIYCLNQNGTLRWRYKTGDWPNPASIGSDGTVYVSSWDGYLYALNPINGSLIWRLGDIHGQSNPSIGPDGTIYTGGQYLYAVNPNGTLRWSYNPGADWVCGSAPAISADGIIYFGTNIGDAQGGHIIAVNPDGTERWRILLASSGWVDSSPSIGSDGTIYIGSCSNGSSYLWAIGNGPLNVDAYGPYTGYYNTSITFKSDAFGGIPSYTYHWDFGDGQTSDQKNPSHVYTQGGHFTATVTATDSEGNTSNDTTDVTVNYRNPTVSITRPVNGFYFKDEKIFPNHMPFIIGPITIQANASQDPLGITHIEFYLDGKLQATDTEAPYTWYWNSRIHPHLNHDLPFFDHIISVIAYDPLGRKVTANIQVRKIL